MNDYKYGFLVGAGFFSQTDTTNLVFVFSSEERANIAHELFGTKYRVISQKNQLNKYFCEVEGLRAKLIFRSYSKLNGRMGSKSKTKRIKKPKNLFEFIRGIQDATSPNLGNLILSKDIAQQVRYWLSIEDIEVDISDIDEYFVSLQIREENAEELFWELYPNGDKPVSSSKVMYKAWVDYIQSFSNIESVKCTDEFIRMMDMEVEDDHEFIAQGIYVHNCAQELRMQANLANVKVWVEAFNSGGDLHHDMAVQMWGAENYDKEKRKRAKTLNFGMLYGMNAYTLVDRLHVSLEEAQDIEHRYWNAVPEITAYQRAMVKKAKRTGTTYSLFGMPRRVKDYFESDDRSRQAFGKRTVGNNVIQCSCATLTQIAFLKVYYKLYSNPDWRDDCHFFSFIHDEIVSSCKKERVLDFIHIQRECMEKKFPNMPVKFETSVAIGNAWGNQKEFVYTEDGEGIIPDVSESPEFTEFDVVEPIKPYRGEQLIEEK